ADFLCVQSDINFFSDGLHQRVAECDHIAALSFGDECKTVLRNGTVGANGDACDVTSANIRFTVRALSSPQALLVRLNPCEHGRLRVWWGRCTDSHHWHDRECSAIVAHSYLVQ